MDEPLLSMRSILIAEPITKDTAKRVMVSLRLLENEDPSAPIWLLFDSLGGEVQAGWTIVDSIALCKCPVNAVCFGEAASIAAVTFASCKRGKRYMLAHARLMIHQPWTGLSSWPMKESDLAAASIDLTKTREEIERSLSRSSGLPLSEVHRLCERDFHMDAEEAIEYGFADAIME